MALKWLQYHKMIIMPYSNKEYPNSFKNFKAKVRHKAIDIANALLEEGKDDSVAIPIAISKAVEWAENRGIEIKKKPDVEK